MCIRDRHNIEIVVDRLIVKPGIEKRLSDSIETVLDLAEGLLMVDTMDGNIHNFSQSFSCPDCGISVDEIEPRSFSFNNPFGACPDCLGPVSYTHLTDTGAPMNMLIYIISNNLPCQYIFL